MRNSASPPTQAPSTAAPVLTPEQRLEMQVRAAERAHDAETAFGAKANEAAVKGAEEAIKAALLINGGSSVAMLAFVGTLLSRLDVGPEQIAKIVQPLLCFGFGVAAAVVASGASYFANLLFAAGSSRRDRSYAEPFIRPTPLSDRHVRAGTVFRWIGVVAVSTSIGCFVWGLITAKSGFHDLNLTPAAKESSKM